MGTIISVITIDIHDLIVNSTIIPKQPITHIITRCGIIEPKICAYMQIWKQIERVTQFQNHYSSYLIRIIVDQDQSEYSHFELSILVHEIVLILNIYILQCCILGQKQMLIRFLLIVIVRQFYCL